MGLNFTIRYTTIYSSIYDFNMELDKGEVLAILGESGIGKSTMLRIIAGLEEAHKGSMTIGDKIIFSEKLFVEPKNRGIGMVFQDYALFPHMTVKKNIQYGLKKMSKAEKENIAMEMLKLANLVEHKDKYPYELSGGQQQRVAIARAIAPKPEILLLDEPFSNLDANLQEKIRDEIKEILKKAVITSIFVTHDREDAKVLADKVIVLRDGITVQKGLSKDILV
ncbi:MULTISPECIES: ABC transporter ATP-binding protein [unclassified Clostridium]|uniref:ABC transporter ATP-binding protein n=1 Tax=unclassified Clostridium TaxID=2614128 RepID=UPI001C8CD93B|nr:MULTISPECIES: ABC transporter ATP-binding protein [unclassified Clostridium]MBX9138935.1 ABC transporter ATP-binding protein [Clostridium sp. K12(2020)]MBX9145727.1 ABC transporter ATP-binding protein [Clostridium sp. K13]